MILLVKLQNNSTTVVFSYESYSDALAEFHTELAYRGDGRTSTMCAILNRAGEVLKRERWEAEANTENTEQ